MQQANIHETFMTLLHLLVLGLNGLYVVIDIGIGTSHFNIFVGDMGNRIRCTLSKFTDNTKLCGVVTCWTGGIPPRGTLIGLRGGPMQTS